MKIIRKRRKFRSLKAKITIKKKRRSKSRSKIRKKRRRRRMIALMKNWNDSMGETIIKM